MGTRRHCALFVRFFAPLSLGFGYFVQIAKTKGVLLENPFSYAKIDVLNICSCNEKEAKQK